MISIELTDTKDFMNKLLRTEIFDNFLLQEAVITKAASYVIDGHLQKGFYSSTELEENGIAGYSILLFLLRLLFLELLQLNGRFLRHVFLGDAFNGSLDTDDNADGSDESQETDNGENITTTSSCTHSISAVLFVTSFEHDVTPTA